MSDSTIEPRRPRSATPPATHAHPSDAHYIKIALFLAALTAAETATYYIPFFEEQPRGCCSWS